MKIINSILIFTILAAASLLAVSFTGCSDSVVNPNGTTKTYRARTEADFLSENLRAEPGAVIVLNLEDLNFLPYPEWLDTDIIGVDIIPYTYTETAEHKISIGDSSLFEITLIDEALKTVIFELTPQNNNITVTIPAGDYLLIITSLKEFGSDTLGSQTVFIQPDMTGTSARGGGFEQVDYDPNQLNTLVSTKSCPGCDLSNAFMPNLILYNANLSNANLSNANLSNTKLSGANLSHANLSNADLRWAYLNGADLSHANLSNAILHNSYSDRGNFSNTDLRSAQLHYAYMQHVNLSNADLRNAKLFDVRLSFANFSGANFCGATKVRIFSQAVIIDHQTQCWP